MQNLYWKGKQKLAYVTIKECIWSTIIKLIIIIQQIILVNYNTTNEN